MSHLQFTMYNVQAKEERVNLFFHQCKAIV